MGTLRLGSSVVVPSVVNNVSTPVIDPLSITPTTSQQTITPPSGTDGYSPITVNAVTSNIDANITSGNIKSGVTILGVIGNVVELNGETKTVIPQTYGQTIYPTNPKNGITEITVNPVTSSIDANITAGNIKKDVQILGVTGTYEGSGSATLITKTITQNGVYDAQDDNADGYSEVTVNVPSSNVGNVIVDVKAYGKCEQNGTPTPTNPVDIVCNNGALKVKHSSDLPLSYTQVEYLQTDGDSYIDTGIAVPTTYKWELTLNSRGTNTSPYWGYANTNSYSAATSFYSLGANGQAGISGIALSIGAYSGTPETDQKSFYNATTIPDAGTLGGDAPHTIRCEGDFVFTADGTPMTQVVSKTFTDFTPTGNAYLFARNTPGISKSGNGTRIHTYKVWNANGVLVQNLIPCTNSSNVAGFYDTVSGNFLTNQGTGTFTAGPIIIDAVGIQETITDANNNTAKCDYLLSLNGHQDTQELVYGKISRNIGMKVLNGTEDWTLNSNRFRCSNLVQNANDITLMCSHFAYTGDLTTDNTIYRASGSNYLQIRYDTANNDVTTFKTFLAQQYSAGTPVIVLYVRTNKYTFTVDGQTLEKTPISVTGSLQNLTTDIYESKDIVSRTLVNDSSTNTVSLYNSSSFDNNIFSTITDVKAFALMYAFARGRYGQTGNEFINNGYIKGSINLSSLKNISVSACYGMFEQQIGITSVDLSSLEIIDKANACYGMFKANTSLTSTGISNLTTISGMNGCNGMYYGDTSLTSTGLSNLTIISGDYACQDMFRLCTGITSETFSKLDTITGSNAMFTMFADNGNLRYLAFPALTLNSFGSNTSQFNSMLYGCRSVVVHFPSNLSALLGSWTSVQNGFGGTSTTILFDLPATE